MQIKNRPCPCGDDWFREELGAALRALPDARIYLIEYRELFVYAVPVG
jgi:hypothetical protein